MFRNFTGSAKQLKLSQTTTPLSPCKELNVLPHTSWINMINDILVSSGRLVNSPGLHHYQSQAQYGRHGRSWGVDLSEIQFSAVQTNGFGLERVFWVVIPELRNAHSDIYSDFLTATCTACICSLRAHGNSRSGFRSHPSVQPAA